MIEPSRVSQYLAQKALITQASAVVKEIEAEIYAEAERLFSDTKKSTVEIVSSDGRVIRVQRQEKVSCFSALALAAILGPASEEFVKKETDYTIDKKILDVLQIIASGNYESIDREAVLEQLLSPTLDTKQIKAALKKVKGKSTDKDVEFLTSLGVTAEVSKAASFFMTEAANFEKIEALAAVALKPTAELISDLEKLTIVDVVTKIIT